MSQVVFPHLSSFNWQRLTPPLKALPLSSKVDFVLFCFVLFGFGFCFWSCSTETFYYLYELLGLGSDPSIQGSGDFMLGYNLEKSLAVEFDMSFTCNYDYVPVSCTDTNGDANHIEVRTSFFDIFFICCQK